MPSECLRNWTAWILHELLKYRWYIFLPNFHLQNPTEHASMTKIWPVNICRQLKSRHKYKLVNTVLQRHHLVENTCLLKYSETFIFLQFFTLSSYGESPTLVHFKKIIFVTLYFWFCKIYIPLCSIVL